LWENLGFGFLGFFEFLLIVERGLKGEFGLVWPNEKFWESVGESLGRWVEVWVWNLGE
jgi:hypothetical protein